MTFETEIVESFSSEVKESMEVLFSAIQDAIDNPTDIIEVHVFNEDTKNHLQDVINDLSISYPEADNIEIIVESIH